MSSYAQRVRVYGTGYDRRVKLTEDDKEYIRWLRDEEGLSYNKLAAKFGVSKRLIMFVCLLSGKVCRRSSTEKSQMEGW